MHPYAPDVAVRDAVSESKRTTEKAVVMVVVMMVMVMMILNLSQFASDEPAAASRSRRIQFHQRCNRIGHWLQKFIE